MTSSLHIPRRSLKAFPLSAFFMKSLKFVRGFSDNALYIGYIFTNEFWFFTFIYIDDLIKKQLFDRIYPPTYENYYD